VFWAGWKPLLSGLRPQISKSKLRAGRLGSYAIGKGEVRKWRGPSFIRPHPIGNPLRIPPRLEPRRWLSIPGSRPGRTYILE
jgi:hypothetical protein